MVVIKQVQRQVVEQAVAPTPLRAPRGGGGELLGAGVGAIGDMLNEWQDDIDTADGKSADAAYSELIRKELYEDETGFMYTQGNDSMMGRESVSKRIEDGYKSIFSELSPAAQAKAKAAMDARQSQAFKNIDVHTSGQRITYLNDASDARLNSAVSDAVFDPDTSDQQLRLATSEIADMADRNGWPPEVAEAKLLEAKTKVHSGIITRLDAANPIAAMEYLKEHKGDMDAAAVARIESVLAPKVKERRGSAIGASVYNSHGVDPDATAALNALEAATGQKFQINSAYRSPEHNKAVGGADHSQHVHGKAFDVDVSGMTIEERQNLIVEARKAGFGGIGVYGNSLHFDTAGTRSWGPTYKNESVPEWAREAVQSPRGETPKADGVQSLLDISDPVERKAAIAEYNLRAGAEAKQAEANRQRAENAAFQMIEGGGNVDNLPIETRQYIGREGMNSLRVYQAKIAAGGTVATDDEFYVELADLMARDPDQFMALDPMTWRDKLDDEDFNYYVKQRTAMIDGKRKVSSTDAPSLSSLRTAASTAMAGAGFTKKDDPEAFYSFESQLLRWAEDYTATNGQKPAQTEIMDQINKQLVPVVLDPKGLGNKQKGSRFEIDFDGKAYDPTDDIQPDDIRGGSLKINDIKVDDETIDIFVRGFADRFGRAPTVPEVVDGLIAAGIYE